MTRTRHARPQPGYMLLEAVVSLGLVGATLTFFAHCLAQTARQHHHIQLRQRAYLAAEAALNDARAGKDVNAAGFAARFPGLTLSLSRRAGTGDWENMTHLIVRVARADSSNGVAGGELARLEGYIREASHDRDGE